MRSWKFVAAGFAFIFIYSLYFGADNMACAAPEWADNFYRSDQVVMGKVTFPNLYKMEVAGDLF